MCTKQMLQKKKKKDDGGEDECSWSWCKISCFTWLSQCPSSFLRNSNQDGCLAFHTSKNVGIESAHVFHSIPVFLPSHFLVTETPSKSPQPWIQASDSTRSISCSASVKRGFYRFQIWTLPRKICEKHRGTDDDRVYRHSDYSGTCSQEN